MGARCSALRACGTGDAKRDMMLVHADVLTAFDETPAFLFSLKDPVPVQRAPHIAFKAGSPLCPSTGLQV